MKKMVLLLFIIFYVFILNTTAQEFVVGQPLPPWKEGYLDLHHINTGRGSVAYYIFPDGTTMLVDAGEMNPLSERVRSPRNSVIRPDSTKKPFEWIAHYIKQVAPQKNKPELDYALITHFHDDHFGSWYPSAPVSSSGKYVLTGIAGVGELIPIHHLLDRGYPNYNYPVSMNRFIGNPSGDSNYYKSIHNYFRFVQRQHELGRKTALFKAGSRRQVVLQHKPKSFPEFYVQNIKANGLIWTGKDSTTLQHFPQIDTANKKTWPDENTLSLALTIHYGPFTYYTGGDNPGNVFYGDAVWRDVETPIAKAAGEVDIATLDHHGNRDAINEFFVKTLKPRIWIGQSWSADHPGHEVLVRMTTPYLYEGPRDLFATNMLEANKIVIGALIDRFYKSDQGHIVVRVLPGGKNYYVIILDDTKVDMPVKDVFGPYNSKTK
jgi:beta-lactamase superfamily II metal-dependent hydrolase